MKSRMKNNAMRREHHELEKAFRNHEHNDNDHSNDTLNEHIESTSSCDVIVKFMSRASHRNIDKRRVNQINENSKLKSEIYQDAKTICTEEREALDSIESRLASRTCVSVED